MTDDELQQYWDARPLMAERLEECFFFDWPPDAVARATGECFEAVCWIYERLREAEDGTVIESCIARGVVRKNGN